MENFWPACLSRFEQELSAQQFNTWIKPLKAEITKNNIQVVAPNKFVQQWVKERFLNKIESISQRASIEFWEKHSGEDCYVHTYGYKSYAHFYYARTKPHINGKQNDANWLLHGTIDKPVYISCKINTYQKFETEVPDAKLLYAKNGFYFYKRSPLLL